MEGGGVIGLSRPKASVSQLMAFEAGEIQGRRLF